MRALEQRGDEVVGLDKKGGEDLSDRRARYAYYTVAAFAPDAIVHLASVCSTPGSVKDPLGTFEDTVTTTALVLEAARAGNVPVLVTSSCKAADGMTPYGAAKRMVELWAEEYYKAYDLPIVINRPGTIYGPGQAGSEDSGWIAWFCKARDEGFPVVINGDGSQIRDLLHVHDYVHLLLLQLDNIGYYTGQTWDVGGGADNTVSVRAMAEHLGLEFSFGPARYGDSPYYVAKNNTPGWGPVIDWRESEILRWR
jgi:CDP-paratose 2-epimerase